MSAKIKTWQERMQDNGLSWVAPYSAQERLMSAEINELRAALAAKTEALADEWGEYLKNGETPLQRLEREIKDSDSLAGLLAAEKRKTLELQRVYDERGLQIARMEAAKTAPAITVESAIQSLVSALQTDKGWISDYADSIVRDAIDRKPAMTVDPETGDEAARISPDESADYRRGWKDGYKHGAWASQPAAPHPLMDEKSLRAKAMLDRVAQAPTPTAPDIEQLLKFYNASNLEQLVRAQAGHIAKLQEKLPPVPPLSPTFPRG